MLKQPPGETDATMCVPDDRPRKKLSFRDPEVVAPTRNGGHPAALAAAAYHRHSALLHHPPQQHHPHPHQQQPHHHQQQHHHHHQQSPHYHTRHTLARPHSIAGIVGLGGLSALGGVPGVANPASVPGTQCVTSPATVSGVTSMLGNTGLLGPIHIPGVLVAAGPVTPILTPPTSPTHTAQTITTPSTSSKSTPSVLPPTPISKVPPSCPPTPTTSTKPITTHPTSPMPKKSPSNPPSSPTPKMSTNPQPSKGPLSPSSGKGAGSGGGGSSSGGNQPPSTPTGKSLPPTGSNTQTKPTKPASRNSSMKKQKPSAFSGVQHAVAFLTERGANVVNGGRQRSSHSHSDNATTAVSLEDFDLESQAMRIVRTVGQAFEVCHKISVKDTPPSPEPPEDEESEHGSDASTDKPRRDLLDTESAQEDLVTLSPSDTVNEDSLELLPQRPNKLEPLAPPVGSDILTRGTGETYASPLSEPLPAGDTLPLAGTPLSVHHELQLLREQLEQQQQQTQAAVSQVHLLRDQLAAETAARLEAQARTHQLLVHNKELLEHIQALVLQVRDLEVKLTGSGMVGSRAASQLVPTPPEIKSQLLVTGASHDHSSRLAAALDLGGLVSLYQNQPPPPTPSPSNFHQPFLFPSSSTTNSATSLLTGLQFPTGAFQDFNSAPVSREPSPRVSAAAGTLIHPLPVSGNEGTSAGEVTLAVPRQEPHLNPLIQAIPRPRAVQRYDECSSTPSLSSESDPKRDSSGQSSGESVTQAVAQLYSMEPYRLAQVPEDAVTLGPYGPTPLGTPRNLNGPITRTASERVSRQETLAQLQRLAWARHTTK